MLALISFAGFVRCLCLDKLLRGSAQSAVHLG